LRDINQALDRLGVAAFIPRTRPEIAQASRRRFAHLDAAHS
jgi:hypothetical protein